jgi:hypothetical protein
MDYQLYEQSGGKVNAQITNNGYTGPKIDPSGTIKMKIELVKDDATTEQTLPSYLIPNLICSGGSNVDGSVVTMTLSGDALQKVATAPTGFTCEITSNFLTGDEKSAITIETYYANSSGVVNNTNIIYFDESLLKYYENTDGKLVQSANPFLANANTTDGGSYTFEFKFQEIIDKIKNLPSYTQIQNMFKLVNDIKTDSTACLVKISDGAFLNIDFKGIPFDTSLSSKKLQLTIKTKHGEVKDDCDLTSAIGSLVLKDKLKNVLALDYQFDLSNISAAPKKPGPSPSPSPSPGPGSTGAGSVKTKEELEEKVKAAEAELKAAQASGDTAAATTAQAKLDALLKSKSIISASAAKGMVVTGPDVNRVNIDITNIQKTIAQLVDKMNVLISQKNQGFGAGPVILGAPGEAGACGKGGMELKSNGKVVIIEVPISMVMSEIMNPTMLVEYSNQNAGKPTIVKQQPPPNAAKNAGQNAIPNAATTGASSVAPSVAPSAATDTGPSAATDTGPSANQNATPIGATIEIDSTKKTKLSETKTTLGNLKQQITGKAISPTPDEVTFLETAVKDAETAVTNFDNATDKAAAKTNAEGLIDKATGLVAAAEQAVTAAIQKKEADDKVARELSVKIGELQDKLTAAEGVLKKANEDYANITPVPSTPPGELEIAEKAIEKATQAIDEILNPPEGAEKDALIQTATDAVQAAVDAAKAAQEAVDAAKPNPTGNTEPTFQDYQVAWNAYQEVKGKFKSATDAAEQAGGADPTDEEKAAAKQKLNEAVKEIMESVNKYEKIDEITDVNSFTALDLDAKKEQIDNLKAATKAYNDALSQLKAAQAEYDKATKPGDSSAKPTGEGAGKDASSAETIQTYSEFYKTFKDCLVEKTGGDSSQEQVTGGLSNDNFIEKLTACFKDSNYDGNVLQQFSKAVLAASLNSKAHIIAPTKFNEEYNADQEDGKINHELLLAIINNLSPGEINQYVGVGESEKSFNDLLKSLVAMLGDNNSDLMKKIQSKYKGEEGGAFSLFDGGSKSSSSKSKSSSSKSKSKPKNKTKKNHSAPKSSKSKTPKIIMNE